MIRFINQSKPNYMLNSKQFYSFPVRFGTGSGGMKFININNIAAIEDLSPGIRVTLNVKDAKKEFITFVADLLFGYVTGQLVAMDNDLHKE